MPIHKMCPTNISAVYVPSGIAVGLHSLHTPMLNAHGHALAFLLISSVI